MGSLMRSPADLASLADSQTISPLLYILRVPFSLLPIAPPRNILYAFSSSVCWLASLFLFSAVRSLGHHPHTSTQAAIPIINQPSQGAVGQIKGVAPTTRVAKIDTARGIRFSDCTSTRLPRGETGGDTLALGFPRSRARPSRRFPQEERLRGGPHPRNRPPCYADPATWLRAGDSLV